MEVMWVCVEGGGVGDSDAGYRRGRQHIVSGVQFGLVHQ